MPIDHTQIFVSSDVHGATVDFYEKVPEDHRLREDPRHWAQRRGRRLRRAQRAEIPNRHGVVDGLPLGEAGGELQSAEHHPRNGLYTNVSEIMNRCSRSIRK